MNSDPEEPAEAAERQQLKESAMETADPPFERILWFFKLFMDQEISNLEPIHVIASRFRGVPRETFLYHLMHYLETEPALRDKAQNAYNVCLDILFRKRARKLLQRGIGDTLPNCFVIGQPRSGTTSLHAFFRSHPEIFVPIAKEVNYYSHFSKPVLGPHGMDLDYYLMYFMDATTERIRCDISPYYISEPGVALRIFRDTPNAKILAVLREPIARLTSMYNLAFPWTTQKDMDNWFLSGMEGLRANAPRWNHTGPVSVLFHCFFASQLSEYKRLFGNFKVFIFEDMMASQEKCYNEICDFLGVARFYDGPYWELRAPAKLRPSAAVTHTLQALLLPEVKRMEAVLGRDLSRWYGEWTPVS